MIWDYLGRFHPVLVHLPIGFYFLGLILKLVDSRKSWLMSLPNQVVVDELVEPSQQSEVNRDRAGNRNQKNIDAKGLESLACGLILKISFFASVFTCITGYLLSQSGEFSGNVLNIHQYLAFVFTGFLGIFAFIKINNPKIILLIWFVLGVLLTVVGHYGGSLTHGEDFLSFNYSKSTPKKDILDIQNASAYNEVIRPILENKCYECHNSKKQKGNLRMDEIEAFVKGGKHGSCLETNKSLLLSRIEMPDGEEEHMPPKGKPQLTQNEVAVLKWWVENRADFKKKVNQIPQIASIVPVLLSFQKRQRMALDLIPEVEVSVPNSTVLKELTSTGIIVLPISAKSNYISINILGNNITDAQWNNLEKIKENIIWFKSNKAQISPKGKLTIPKLINLKLLHLNFSNYSDVDVASLVTLKNLSSLNLIGNKLTMNGLTAIKNLPQLQKLFLFETFEFKVEDIRKLQRIFPNVVIDFGNYKVPTFEADTVQIPYT